MAGTEEWEFTEVELDTAEAEVETNGTEAANITEAGEAEAGVYRGSLELTSLQPGTEYEVTVATSNSFGLGQHGDIYTFTTRARGQEHRRMTRLSPLYFRDNQPGPDLGLRV